MRKHRLPRGRSVRGDASHELRHDDFLAVGTAARIAGCSVRTIRRAYRDGRLVAYRDGNGHGVRVRYGDLRRWMMATRVGPASPGDAEQAASVVEHVDMRGKSASTSSGEYLTLLNAARARQGH